LSVPTCQRDRKTGGRDRKRHTYLPGCGVVGFFSFVVVIVRVLGTTVVVVVDVVEVDVVEVDVVVVDERSVVVVEPATVVVVTGIVVVDVVVGTEVFTLILT
jgi:hypothetical protein